MGIFDCMLLVATLLCSLVAGFVFAFAVVVMPGIRKLEDAGFIRAFQVIDRVIQQNQPLFMVVWVGSAVTLIAATGLGIAVSEGAQRALLIVAAGLYLLAVQLPTIAINVPLNNTLQKVNIDEAEPAQLRAARDAFESDWVRWNTIRTLFACFASALLMTVLWLM